MSPILIGPEIYRGSTCGPQHPLAIPRVSTCRRGCRRRQKRCRAVSTGRNPPEHWFTALADAPQPPVPVKPKIRALCPAALRHLPEPPEPLESVA